MNLETKSKVIEAADKRRRAISDSKGAEYTLEGEAYKEADADTLSNFKRIGEKLNLDPVVICAVYTMKHIDSITTFLRRYQEETDPHKRRELAEEGEGIVSRLDDARNYLDILECLLYESGVHPDSTQDLMPEFRDHYPGTGKVVATEPIPHNEARENDILLPKTYPVRQCSIINAHDQHRYFFHGHGGPIGGVEMLCPGRIEKVSTIVGDIMGLGRKS